MDSETVARLQTAHDEAFERYLVAERTLRIARQLTGNPARIRMRRNDLRRIAAAYAEIVVNARSGVQLD